MLEPGYLIAIPMLAFLGLSIFSSFLSKRMAMLVGVAGIALSAVGAMILFVANVSGDIASLHAWTWIPRQLLGHPEDINIGFVVDTLSLTMCLMITFVSTLIAIYSTEYMAKDDGICRYFGVMNLFVACMLILVLADNLLLLFLGWEGVGLASYLLIGFYFKEEKAQSAAMKAFITTRIGDVFLLFGILICYLIFDTVNIHDVIERASAMYPKGDMVITIAALCFLGGACGKSAQIPLQTWLADAMWGPTPVSALIHAATMVTAGVYLIARMSGLFYLSQIATAAVLWVGATTMIVAGIAALYQTDLKRVLAYSTMSQLGLMFVALGVQAPAAATFHLVTHAFFKALLFLATGVIGHALHSYDLAKMGGLARKMPILCAIFLVGGASLMGVPLISAGFFSKEWIFSSILAYHGVNSGIFILGLAGAFLTALYTVRMLVLVFLGQSSGPAKNHSGWAMMVPLGVLSLFSLGFGWLQAPHAVADINIFSQWLAQTLPARNILLEESWFDLALPSIAMSFGAVFAFVYYRVPRKFLTPQWLRQVLFGGAGFDWFYTVAIARPYQGMSLALKNDFVESIAQTIVSFVVLVSLFLRRLHSGHLSHYLSILIMAALVMTGVMVMS